jgi:hypothetical protein
MAWLLDNPDREYIEAVKTDVMRTWRKFGFIPPSELKGQNEKFRGEVCSEVGSRQTQKKDKQT